jgi:hypothetical protein
MCDEIMLIYEEVMLICEEVILECDEVTLIFRLLCRYVIK